MRGRDPKSLCKNARSLEVSCQTDVMAKDPEPQWGYFAGIGSIIAVGAALGYFVGHWLDQRYGWRWGAVIGAMLGVASGMYTLIKDAIKMNKD